MERVLYILYAGKIDIEKRKGITEGTDGSGCTLADDWLRTYVEQKML